MDNNEKRTYNNAMAQYAIAFDIDTTGMKESGWNKSQITQLYQIEIPQALEKCGFTVHPQGSLYHTNVEKEDALAAIMTLQSSLKTFAPNFCNWIKRVHVFRMDEWSDVTSLLSTKKIVSSPISVDEEIEQQEIINT